MIILNKTKEKVSSAWPLSLQSVFKLSLSQTSVVML